MVLPVSGNTYIPKMFGAYFEFFGPENAKWLCCLVLGGCGFLVYYFVEVAQKPLLACQKGTWSDILIGNIPVLNRPFWPTVWAFEGRMQTILASLVRSTLPDLSYKREVLPLKDGGLVSLDWRSQPGANDAHSPLVVCLPGLTGHSQSDYIKALILTAEEAGSHCVVFNYRGRGGVALKTPRTYCGANSEDFVSVLEHIRKKYPEAPLIAVGVSLGGMILGNYLTSQSSHASNHLLSAMLISAPWDVFKGTKSLEKPFLNLMLNKHLAKCLVESVIELRSHLEHVPWELDFSLVLQSRTIREFDTHFTAKQFGFPSLEAYYKAACLHDKVHQITVPTLCLAAADDPFQPKAGIPIDEAFKSSRVAIVVTAAGGHIGFMEGLFPSKKHYSDHLFGQYLKAVLANKNLLEDMLKTGVITTEI